MGVSTFEPGNNEPQIVFDVPPRILWLTVWDKEAQRKIEKKKMITVSSRIKLEKDIFNL